MALLAAGAPAAHAEDFQWIVPGSQFWDVPSNWSPTGEPGAGDRAIFAAGGSANLGTTNSESVGQLVFSGSSAGHLIQSISGSNTLTIDGIDGVGVDVQGNYVATLFNRTVLADSQTWQATNLAGGGFRLLSTPGYVDLGTHTLTVHLVNALNTGQIHVLRCSGDLVKTGLGTLTLTGNSASVTNSFTGRTLIDEGTVALTSVGSIAKSSEVVADGTFDISGLSGAGTSIMRLNGDGFVALGTKLLTLTAAQAGDDFAGIIGGSGGIVLAGGTQILSGISSYSGGTFLNGGVLSISTDFNLGNAAGSLTFDGGTLQNTGAFASARSVTIDDGGGTFETLADLTLSSVIGGVGELNKTGNAKLTLTGDSSGFTGLTQIHAGILEVNGSLCGPMNVLSGDGCRAPAQFATPPTSPAARSRPAIPSARSPLTAITPARAATSRSRRNPAMASRQPIFS